MIKHWSQKRSRSGPRDTPKEKQQHFPQVDQKAPRVDQKAPQNDTKKDIQIMKKLFGWCLFHFKKTMIIWKLCFLVFCPPWEVPDPENQAKTLQGCAKTRVPPFQEKQHFFTKTNQK